MRFIGKRKLAISCATSWTTLSVATSTIHRWYGAAISRAPSPLPDTALLWRKGCVASSKPSWLPSTQGGLTNWEGLERNCSPARSNRNAAADCCIRQPAIKRSRLANLRASGRKRILSRWPMNGKVFLVGAGPGDPELLTIKALRTLQSADAVLHDDLVSPEILALIPASAEVRNVGKRCGRKNITQEEINALLVAFASFGLKVVRLKSGDPLIFGRAGEEMQALRKAGIDFEVVPGVTSALASAAAARISLTHRESASAVLFVTGHHAKATKNVEWRRYVGA